MRGDEGSLSNPRRAKVEGGVFMTPILSHQVGWFRHVWEEKKVCPLVKNPHF
jgi:hypothetical protein